MSHNYDTRSKRMKMTPQEDIKGEKIIDISEQTDPGPSTFTSELHFLTTSHRKHELLICLC